MPLKHDRFWYCTNCNFVGISHLFLSKTPSGALCYSCNEPNTMCWIKLSEAIATDKLYDLKIFDEHISLHFKDGRIPDIAT